LVKLHRYIKIKVIKILCMYEIFNAFVKVKPVYRLLVIEIVTTGE